MKIECNFYMVVEQFIKEHAELEVGIVSLEDDDNVNKWLK